MSEFSILTLNWTDFHSHCKNLRELVESSGFIPDAVVAIPRGGLYVAQCTWGDVQAINITIHKPKNISLKKIAKPILCLMPPIITNALRKLDAKRLVKRTSHISSTDIQIISPLPPHIKKILLLDDAVDSGATLKAVIEAFKTLPQNLEIKSAALTVTSPTPLVSPDFFIYHNQTLIRMPWSIDAPKK